MGRCLNCFIVWILGNLEIVTQRMEPGSNGRDVVSHPVERAWEVRRQQFSKLRDGVKDSLPGESHD